LRSFPKRQQRDESAETRRRETGEDRERVDEALVQDAEDEVDHEDRDHEEEREAADGRLNTCAVPWNVRRDRERQDLVRGLSDARGSRRRARRRASR